MYCALDVPRGPHLNHRTGLSPAPPSDATHDSFQPRCSRDVKTMPANVMRAAGLGRRHHMPTAKRRSSEAVVWRHSVALAQRPSRRALRAPARAPGAVRSGSGSAALPGARRPARAACPRRCARSGSPAAAPGSPASRRGPGGGPGRCAARWPQSPPRPAPRPASLPGPRPPPLRLILGFFFRSGPFPAYSRLGFVLGLDGLITEGQRVPLACSLTGASLTSLTLLRL